MSIKSLIDDEIAILEKLVINAQNILATPCDYIDYTLARKYKHLEYTDDEWSFFEKEGKELSVISNSLDEISAILREIKDDYSVVMKKGYRNI